jgi:AcrR family transcriptional regulator
MATSPSSLRARHAAQTRAAVLDAFADALGRGEAVPAEELALRAGISRRTLYRYFPDRAALVDGLADRLYGEDGELPVEIDGPDDIVPSFRRSSARSTQNPQLARALLASAEGRAVRSGGMAARAAAIARAMAPITGNLSARERRRAIAVVQDLCSSRSWVTLHFEHGLPVPDARAAAEWNLRTFLDAVRARNADAG